MRRVSFSTRFDIADTGRTYSSFSCCSWRSSFWYLFHDGQTFVCQRQKRADHVFGFSSERFRQGQSSHFDAMSHPFS
jgi:hypothetical protein